MPPGGKNTSKFGVWVPPATTIGTYILCFVVPGRRAPRTPPFHSTGYVELPEATASATWWQKYLEFEVWVPPATRNGTYILHFQVSGGRAPRTPLSIRQGTLNCRTAKKQGTLHSGHSPNANICVNSKEIISASRSRLGLATLSLRAPNPSWFTQTMIYRDKRGKKTRKFGIQDTSVTKVFA